MRRARKLLGLPLELAYGQLRLADDRFERSTLDLSVVGDGDSNGRAGNPLLHNNVTASFSIVPTAISYTLRKKIIILHNGEEADSQVKSLILPSQKPGTLV